MRSILLSILFISSVFPQEFVVTGIVTNENDQPVEGVNITSGSNGTTSNSKGEFEIATTNEPILFHHIAYQTVSFKPEGTTIVVKLKSNILKGEEIFVSATRAVAGVTPVAFSNLTPEEISDLYTVEDVPMILASEPGVYAYSESGNGTGYSYVSIRGFDQSKIAVMLDNVPLNDNESHQVYWVDHTDILSDAKDVQIQRGIGNSLYGSAAFGGSINVTTKIRSESPYTTFTYGQGSFNTKKYSLAMNSGNYIKNLSLKARYSQTESDGYRDYHESYQRALSFGAEYRSEKITNQFRALIGYENTDLTWDGIYSTDIDDREKRVAGYKAYTDDFLQQIYSLNTRYSISPGLTLSNATYFVNGNGYYEVFRYGEDWNSYNLDIFDLNSNEEGTDFLRRKWIVNKYYGVIPVLTFDNLSNGKIRIDIGGELRFYEGEHFGEISDFSDSTLSEYFGDDWYKYYEYVGRKTSFSAFMHLVYELTPKVKLVGDVQFQQHNWTLDQEPIGHAAGHQLSAKWPFLNPRIGLIFNPSKTVSVFVNYGTAQKEPADNQIIQPDESWTLEDAGKINFPAAEVIQDIETGFHYRNNKMQFGMNLYRINYENEQLKNIDVEQEGEYDYTSADATLHQGVELECAWTLTNNLSLSMNGSVNNYIFQSGEQKGNILPNTPSSLFNLQFNYSPIEKASTFFNLRHVGKQYLDQENRGEIDPYSVIDVGLSYKTDRIAVKLKVNNLLDELYSTFGYAYEWDGYHAYYWPAATRNTFVTLEYKL